MKWSDGNPFTADDVIFWYEDVLMNEVLTPVVPDWLRAGNKPVVVRKADDHTVTFTFAEPQGLLLRVLAEPTSGAPTNYPAHYMKQFHKKYNKNVDQQAKKAKMKDWMSLFQQQAGGWSGMSNKDKPVLFGWKFTQSWGEATDQLVAERNPYYWKVDPDGNQLPYIDKAVYTFAHDVNVIVLKALNGEIDMQVQNINSLQSKPVFYKGQQKGNYHFIDILSARMNEIMIHVNMTHRDPVKRKVFQDKNFRMGLSYAINRRDVIDTAFVGQEKPYQGAPRPESKFYNQNLAKQYTEYSMEKANQYLDKVLPKKDAQGRRLGPDGKPFFFTVENTGAPDDVAVLELVQRYWKEVGIGMSVKSETLELFYERAKGNSHDAAAWKGQGGLEVLLDPTNYFPFSLLSWYAIGWAMWYLNPKSNLAVEPPRIVKKQMNLYDQIRVTHDPGKQDELMSQILRIAKDEFYAIGISLPSQGFGIVKDDFHNVPKSMLDAWQYPTPAPTNPQQYFIKQK